MRSCCHLFFALMSTSQEALIHNLANGGKERKGHTREARHTGYIIPFNRAVA